MEVHAHAHTERKRFKHYLFEFFMLFLAVFCGFLAENFRERQVEQHREKEYMRSLVQDLNGDIKEIQERLELGAAVSEKSDSLVYILNNEDLTKNIQVIYRLALTAGRVVRVFFNDRTSSQLKSSGNMRLIRNNTLSDSIQSYWTQVSIDESIAGRLEDLLSKATDLGIQIFSNKYYERRDPLNPFVPHVKDNAKLINNDPGFVMQFSNRVNSRLGVLYNYMINLRDTKDIALRLIAFIRKEYHFPEGISLEK